MRAVKLKVTSTKVAEGVTFAYPGGADLGYFAIPTYALEVSGTDSAHRRVSKTFEVFRFGMHCTNGRDYTIVGLAKHQVYTIKHWLPNYNPHSFASDENGAWQVHGNFLIHDGPDDATRTAGASIGCIELIGPRAFIEFNDMLFELTGVTGDTRSDKCAKIARGHVLHITYMQAEKPHARYLGPRGQ